MDVTLNGVISISVCDEWLFDGQPLPVSFVCELSEESLRFEDGKVKMSFTVPVELAVGDDEWSRAMGEVLARVLYSTSPDESASP